MVAEDSENEFVLPPGVFGRKPSAAAWRAGLVFILAYILPVLVLGRTSLSHGVQWFGILLTYFLVSLAIFRVLEARSGGIASDLLDESDVAPSYTGALDEVVGSDSGATVILNRPNVWSPELLHRLDWKRMVELCLAYFADRFRCQTGDLSAEGNVEIRLYKDAGERPVAIVQCRAWGEPEVGLASVEAFSVLMAQELIAKGFCIAFGGFSAEVREFAKNQGITLIDDVMFITMMGRLPEDRRQQLLGLAVDGDYATPSCPACGLKMIIRQNEQVRYWGCRAYPRCKGVLGMRHKKTVAQHKEQGA